MQKFHYIGITYLLQMQPLDPHTLFSIFEQGDEAVYKEHGMESTLDNPFVLMGMVLRGMENFHIMDVMYKKQYPKEYKEVRGGVQYKYFCRLYEYLTRVTDLTPESIYKIGESFDRGSIFLGLDNLRVFFEGVEEYEKCGVIKCFQELIIEAPEIPEKKLLI